MRNSRMLTLCGVVVLFAGHSLFGQDQPLVYEGTAGPGLGKHIVLMAGDHEYRSEQTIPMLGRILAKHYGFKCTVLFSIDKKTGEILPGSSYMPGTEALNDADLAVFFLRFQNFPADQMQPIIDYLDRAGPVVGLRTSTHAFQIPADSPFKKYAYNYKGEDYAGGFGRQVLGETWAGHYGENHKQSTQIQILESQADHPILRGVKDPWAYSGGYWTDPMPDSEVLAMSQPLSAPTKGAGPAADKKPCPNCWTRNYVGKDAAQGRVFTTTSGASQDFVDDDFRRLLVNACLWSAGMDDAIVADSSVELVGPYHVSAHQMNSNYFLGVKPQDLTGWDSPIMPADKPLKGQEEKKSAKKSEPAPTK